MAKKLPRVEGRATHKVINPEEKECICEHGTHIVTWSGWFTDDIEGNRIYCTTCNTVWNEI